MILNTIKAYDVIVVGAGHAGCEAAAAAANMGSSVLIVTMDMTKIAQMSCNPAMGGIAKGQIIREIDAIGGYSGIITDRAMIQFRMLNRSKGPAMWSPRAQCDRVLFGIEWRRMLEKIKLVDFWQDAVNELIIEDDVIQGVRTKNNVEFRGRAVILTTGTFGNGLIHIGRVRQEGGRISEPASYGITEQLRKLKFETDRMKTGTPARIDGRTVNFNIMEKQYGDNEGGCFSFLTRNRIKTNQCCYITYTNERTHRVLERGFKDSPLYNGTINSIGPRYCPSIEDKIVTFAEKKQHQLFLEPEGKKTIEYYINGFSSSLPWNIQYEAIRTIAGLENAMIFRPGYAIEYDYYPPYQLNPTLETKKIRNLFFAGQINGTTGYEEAAGQGLIAGMNAHLKLNNRVEFILKRNESYIGVLIDDLVTKGVDEPYRMFTSRAEYRILLRQDNADERLTEKSYNAGLASNLRLKNLEEKINNKRKLIAYLKMQSIEPKDINCYLGEKRTNGIKQKVKVYDLVSRPQINLNDLLTFLIKIGKNGFNKEDFPIDLINSVETDIKYHGYKEREQLLAEKMERLEEVKINEYINFEEIKSISTEGRHKLKKFKPKTIGQASRIPGVSPSDINILLALIGR